MAINVLEAQANRDPNHRHHAHHDIESFYWLLVYVVLRNTDHNLDRLMCSRIFDSHSKQGKAAAKAKRIWLKEQSLKLEIRFNAPLNKILHDLTTLVRNQVENGPATPTLLTHQAFLDVLDRALEMKEWPDCDKAIPFIMPDSETGEPSRHHTSKTNRKKRPADELDSDRGSTIQSTSQSVNSAQQPFLQGALASHGFASMAPSTKKMKITSDPSTSDGDA
jgi:hypothetical protein